MVAPFDPLMQILEAHRVDKAKQDGRNPKTEVGFMSSDPFAVPKILTGEADASNIEDLNLLEQTLARVLDIKKSKLESFDDDVGPDEFDGLKKWAFRAMIGTNPRKREKINQKRRDIHMAELFNIQTLEGQIRNQIKGLDPARRYREIMFDEEARRVGIARGNVKADWIEQGAAPELATQRYNNEIEIIKALRPDLEITDDVRARAAERAYPTGEETPLQPRERQQIEDTRLTKMQQIDYRFMDDETIEAIADGQGSVAEFGKSQRDEWRKQNDTLTMDLDRAQVTKDFMLGAQQMARVLRPGQVETQRTSDSFGGDSTTIRDTRVQEMSLYDAMLKLRTQYVRVYGERVRKIIDDLVDDFAPKDDPGANRRKVMNKLNNIPPGPSGPTS